MKQDDFEIIWHRVKKITGWKKQNDLCIFLGITSASVSGAKALGVFREPWAKKIAEEYNTTVEEILRGKPQHSSLAESQDPAISTDYDNFRISEKIQKTVEVLESNTIYRAALSANIDAFHHGITQEQIVLDQQQLMKEQQQRMASLEARVASLEKLLASATATPDDHQEEPKSNNNAA